MEIEPESEIDDSDLDPDYIFEKDLTPTASGENKIHVSFIFLQAVNGLSCPIALNLQPML